MSRVYSRRVEMGVVIVALFGLAAYSRHEVQVSDKRQIMRIGELTAATNKALTVQIPGLRKQIRDRDVTISDQQSVIGQAVAAITTLCSKLEARGGDCGRIELKPPVHPPKGG